MDRWTGTLRCNGHLKDSSTICSRLHQVHHRFDNLHDNAHISFLAPSDSKLSDSRPNTHRYTGNSTAYILKERRKEREPFKIELVLYVDEES